MNLQMVLFYLEKEILCGINHLNRSSKRKQKMKWNQDICEKILAIVLAVILMIMAFTQSEPVDVYNMTVEEQIKSEREILGR